MQKKYNKKCKKGCEGYIISGSKGLYCPHIESQMPKPSRQSIKAFVPDKIENFWVKTWAADGISIDDILKSLSGYGLAAYEIRLIYYRAVEGLSFKELVKKQGWVSVQSASYYYKEALRKLRVGGFKVKCRNQEF